MSRLSGDKKFYEITVPGSHDAGVFSTDAHTHFGLKKKWAVCQHGDFFSQCQAGSRFFDCRVYLSKTGRGTEMRFGHFAGTIKVPLTKYAVFGEKSGLGGQGGRGGSYGGTFLDGLNDAYLFVKSYPSEFVVLRFSHSGARDEVPNAVKSRSQGDKDFEKRLLLKPANIAAMRVDELRGKIILIFDQKDGYKIDPYSGVHAFNRFDTTANAPPLGAGLVCCGKYAASRTIDKVLNQASQDLTNHQTHATNHLLFVYYQLRLDAPPGDIKHYATEKDSGPHKQLTGFIQGMLYPNKVAKPPNVISHDFVAEESCKKVISLNDEYASWRPAPPQPTTTATTRGEPRGRYGEPSGT